MRNTLFLSATLLGLALTAPGFAQTNTESRQGMDRSGSAAPDHTAGESSYTGHGRMGNKSLGTSNGSGKGGPSENAGSDNSPTSNGPGGNSPGSNSPGGGGPSASRHP